MSGTMDRTALIEIDANSPFSGHAEVAQDENAVGYPGYRMPGTRTEMSMGKRKLAAWASIVGGAIFVIAGITTWVIVSNTLADQKIVTSSDACLPDKEVSGPFTAYCQAKVIDKHTKDITGGKTYAELDREDPNRETAMTSSFLQASLFTSVVAFGVALMAVVVGALFMLIGFALRPEADSAAAPPSEAAAA